MPPRTSMESYGPKLPHKNLFGAYPMRRAIDNRHSLENLIFENLKNLSFSLQIPLKWLFDDLKIKKSPPPHVCDHKIRFTHRTTTPFVSADTHGPKDVFESKF